MVRLAIFSDFFFILLYKFIRILYNNNQQKSIMAAIKEKNIYS